MNDKELKIVHVTDYISPSLPQLPITCTEEEKLNILKKRGFEKSESGKWKFYHNTFAEFFEKHVEVRLIEDTKELTIFNVRKGIYEVANAEELIHKVIRHMMNQIYQLWNPHFGSTAYLTIKHNTMKIASNFNAGDYINLIDGVLDLETMELRPHSPDYLCTTQLPFKYANTQRDISVFLKYLDDVTLGDESMKLLIQEMFGYLLSHSTKAESSFWMVGNGANGKSVMANLIQELVGEGQYSNTSLTALKGPFGLSQLLGKTVNICSENSAGIICSEIYKGIVSGDTLEINRKYKEPISSKITAKLVLLFNELPTTVDYSYGFLRKIIILPFRRTFSVSERDPLLFDKIKVELPGILHWALVGLTRLREQNYQFTYCKVCDEALSQYKKEQNPVSIFFESCFQVDENNQIRKSMIYSTYVNYCQENSYTPLNCQTFWHNLKLYFASNGQTFRMKKIKGYEYLEGLRFK